MISFLSWALSVLAAVSILVALVVYWSWTGGAQHHEPGGASRSAPRTTRLALSSTPTRGRTKSDLPRRSRSRSRLTAGAPAAPATRTSAIARVGDDVDRCTGISSNGASPGALDNRGVGEGIRCAEQRYGEGGLRELDELDGHGCSGARAGEEKPERESSKGTRTAREGRRDPMRERRTPAGERRTEAGTCNAGPARARMLRSGSDHAVLRRRKWHAATPSDDSAKTLVVCDDDATTVARVEETSLTSSNPELSTRLDPADAIVHLLQETRSRLDDGGTVKGGGNVGRRKATMRGMRQSLVLKPLITSHRRRASVQGPSCTAPSGRPPPPRRVNTAPVLSRKNKRNSTSTLFVSSTVSSPNRLEVLKWYAAEGLPTFSIFSFHHALCLSRALRALAPPLFLQRTLGEHTLLSCVSVSIALKRCIESGHALKDPLHLEEYDERRHAGSVDLPEWSASSSDSSGESAATSEGPSLVPLSPRVHRVLLKSSFHIPPSFDEILEFLRHIFKDESFVRLHTLNAMHSVATRLSQFHIECCVMMLIYIDRITRCCNHALHASNWKRLVVATLLIAVKVFRESGVKNANFTAILPNLEVTDLNALEKCTLNYLDYGVSISTQQCVRATRYAKYYFRLRSLGFEHLGLVLPNAPLSRKQASALEAQSLVLERTALRRRSSSLPDPSGSPVRSAPMILN